MRLLSFRSATSPSADSRPAHDRQSSCPTGSDEPRGRNQSLQYGGRERPELRSMNYLIGTQVVHAPRTVYPDAPQSPLKDLRREALRALNHPPKPPAEMDTGRQGKWKQREL